MNLQKGDCIRISIIDRLLRLLQKFEKENCLSFPPPITKFEGRLQWESSIFNGLYNTLDSRFHGNDDFCKSLY